MKCSTCWLFRSPRCFRNDRAGEEFVASPGDRPCRAMRAVLRLARLKADEPRGGICTPGKRAVCDKSNSECAECWSRWATR